jgi:hypothetical protein
MTPDHEQEPYEEVLIRKLFRTRVLAFLLGVTAAYHAYSPECPKRYWTSERIDGLLYDVFTAVEARPEGADDSDRVRNHEATFSSWHDDVILAFVYPDDPRYDRHPLDRNLCVVTGWPNPPAEDPESTASPDARPTITE